MRKILTLAILVAGAAAAPATAQQYTGRILGVVFDSTRMTVLPGAEVRLTDTDYATTADAQGRFFLTGLPAGSYEVAVTHPRLDSLGVEVLRTPLEVASDQTSTALVAVPSVEGMLGPMCTEPDSSVGAVVGFIRDGVTGVTLPGARVVLWARGEGGVQGILNRLAGNSDNDLESVTTPLQVGLWRSDDGLETVADPYGRFVICGLPAGRALVLETSFLGYQGEKVAVTVPHGAAAAQSLPIVITEPARVVGRLVDEQTGEPIVAATVELREENLGVLTDNDGRFVFPAIPPGNHTLVVTHVAYGETEASIDAVGGRTVEIDAKLAQQVIELDEIRVVAEGYARAAARTRGTPVRVMDRQEIEALSSNARNAADLVRRIPGLMVTGGVGSGGPACVQSMQRNVSRPAAPGDPPGARITGGCDQIAVYVDDVHLTEVTSSGATVGNFLASLPVDDIESIEFLKASEAGIRYGNFASQGVLLIYTLGNGPTARRRRP